MNKEIKERILIVEDDLPNMIMALMAFEEESFEVIVVSNYEDALDKVDEFVPDFALLDVNIKGGGTGKDIARVLKGKSIPYLYVTGVSTIVNNHAHGIEAIEIRNDNEVILSIEKAEKDQEVWRTAYEKLKERR